MRVLDLFSGIGGFSLGLERAGMRTIAFCEIDPYCQRILKRHWPGVPCYDDVTTLTAAQLPGPIDVICGGFPCQDVSIAGKGAGITGSRSGLWKHYARIIGEVRPKFVIVENVSALLHRGLGDVLGDLAALGYDAEWHCIPASAVGAPHRRDRIWIVAYAAGDGWPEGQFEPDAGRHQARRERTGQSGGICPDVAHPDQPRLEGWLRAGLRQCAEEQSSGQGSAYRRSEWQSEPEFRGVADGLSTRLHKGGLNETFMGSEKSSPEGHITDGKDLRTMRQGTPSPETSQRLFAADKGRDPLSGLPRQGGPARRPPASETAESVHDLQQQLHAKPQQETQYMQSGLPVGGRATQCHETVASHWAGGEWPGVPRVAVGVPNRVNRLRALGNAVVPQIPEMIGRAIMARN